MRQNNPWNSYRRIATQTATPGQLVLMLYDGAIGFLNRALSGFNKEDPAEFNQTISNNVLRALEIVNELNSSLNTEAGGELAVHLRRVYQYVEWRLTDSNNKKQADGINEAIAKLSTIRNSWAAMLEAQSPAIIQSQQPQAELAAV